MFCEVPCAVFFDGIENGDGSGEHSFETVEKYQFNWDFGPGTESDTSSLGRTFVGFMAAHVFETPGVYQVSLSLTSGDGEVVGSDTVTIEVQSSSRSVKCVSLSGNFTGCPSQNTADHFTDVASAWSGFGPNTELRFRRGESYLIEQAYTVPEDSLLGAYGTGGTPQIHINTPAPGSAMNFGHRSSSVELHFTGFFPEPDPKPWAFLYAQGENVLMLRTEIGEVYCHHKGLSAHTLTFLVDSEIHDTNCATESYGVFASSSVGRWAAFNSTIRNTQRTNIRSYVDKALIANMTFGYPKTNPVLRFYPKKWGLVTGCTSETDGSPHFGIGHNCCSADAFQPTNVIVEKNIFLKGFSSSVTGGGRNIVVRNNVTYDAPGLVSIAYDKDPQGQFITTENVSVYNNTIFSPGLRSLLSTQQNEDNYKSIKVFNNIVYGTVKDSSPRLYENRVISGNLELSEVTAHHNFFSFPMAPPEHEVYELKGQGYSLSEWQQAGKGTGSGEFVGGMFEHPPLFSEKVSHYDDHFEVTALEGSAGTEFTSSSISFEMLKVIPGISTIFVTESPLGPGVFDCNADGQPDEDYRSCRYMKAAEVSGNTIVMEKDILHVAGPIDVTLLIWYSPSTTSRLYTFYPEKYQVGDSITYYDIFFEDEAYHEITSLGQDSHGDYFELSSPLLQTARTGGYIRNWGTSPSSVIDLQLRPGAAAIDSGADAPVFQDFHSAERPVDGDSAGGAAWDAGAYEYVAGER